MQKASHRWVHLTHLTHSQEREAAKTYQVRIGVFQQIVNDGRRLILKPTQQLGLQSGDQLLKRIGRPWRRDVTVLAVAGVDQRRREGQKSRFESCNDITAHGLSAANDVIDQMDDISLLDVVLNRQTTQGVFLSLEEQKEQRSKIWWSLARN